MSEIIVIESIIAISKRAAFAEAAGPLPRTAWLVKPGCECQYNYGSSQAE